MFKCICASKIDNIKLVLFKIVLHSEQEYRPGTDVSGICIVKLNGEMDVNQLVIKIQGEAHVSWREGRGWTRKDSAQCLKLNYHFENYKPRIMKSGRYQIPFCIRLPDSNIPSSFEGNYGWIRYHVIAEIHDPKVLTRLYKTQLPIFISAPAYVCAQQLKARRTIREEKTLGLCCTRGYVSLRCDTTYGQLVGTVAGILVNAVNRSNSEIMLSAILKQTIRYYIGEHCRRTKYKLATVVRPGIQPNSSIKECLSLNIPSELIVSLIQRPMIYIDYEIVVTLAIPYSYDLCAYLPIIVTNQKFVTNN